MDGQDPRSIPEILTAVAGDLADLVRKEGELIRAEVSEKVQEASRAGVRISLGAALLLGAFLVLLQALVIALSKVMDPLWASLIVGVVVGLIGYSLVKSGAGQVSGSKMSPERSTRQVRKDAQLIKGQAQ